MGEKKKAASRGLEDDTSAHGGYLLRAIQPLLAHDLAHFNARFGLYWLAIWPISVERFFPSTSRFSPII